MRDLMAREGILHSQQELDAMSAEEYQAYTKRLYRLADQLGDERNSRLLELGQLPIYHNRHLATMSAQECKSYETRVRRTAARRGLRLERSRRRDPLATGFGKYRVVDASTGEVLYNCDTRFKDGFLLSLGDVALRLNGNGGVL